MTCSSASLIQFVDVGVSACRRESIEMAFDRCGRGLYRYIALRTGDSHLADDLMQQLWLSATTRAAIVPDDDLEAWLMAIARNLVRAHWRRTATRPAHVPIADSMMSAELAKRLATEELPPEIVERRELCDQLLLAVTALRSQEQDLIVGHYFHGRTLAELVAAQGLSERAVEGRLYRARQSLRETLREFDP